MGVAGSAWDEGSGPDDQGLPSQALRPSSGSSIHRGHSGWPASLRGVQSSRLQGRDGRMRTGCSWNAGCSRTNTLRWPGSEVAV